MVPLRDRFWLFPGLLCLGGVILAEGLILLDQRIPVVGGRWGPLAYQVGVAGSRDLLGAVAGSVLTAAATTFSITVAVLALTSSTYGPRLVRNFMSDRGNQAVLGVLLATFLYALLVLRAVRDESTLENTPAFVPHLAVNVAVALAVLDVAALVYFIHHISDSIQISVLSGRVRKELRRTICHLYPNAGADARQDRPDLQDSGPVTADEVLPVGWRRAAVPATVQTDGYVASVDLPALVRLAEEREVTVILECRPGDHVVRDDPVVRLWRGDGAHESVSGQPDGRGASEEVDRVRRAVIVGDARTPRQDLRFAVRQLVEITVRALSPAVNDPFTAMNAVDDLSAGLCLMATRRAESPVRLGSQGEVRLIAPGVGLDEVLADVFAFLRGYAADSPSVLHRGVDLASAVGRRSGPGTRRLLDGEVAALVDAFHRRDPLVHDLERLGRHAATVRERLRAPAEAWDGRAAPAQADGE